MKTSIFPPQSGVRAARLLVCLLALGALASCKRPLGPNSAGGGSSTSSSSASGAVWTWLAGSNTIGASGTYGTRGTPSTTNIPGARQGGAAWQDASGNFWLFGGLGVDSTGSSGYLNDLWEYSPSAATWTWVSGADTIGASGVYGTQLSASSTNAPGARWGSATWRDTSGNFWMFGGYGFDSVGSYGYLNDLWQFNPSTGWWTWEGGANSISTGGYAGVYGSLNSPLSTNLPGPRNGAGTWVDSAGRLWLFGGQGYGATANALGYLNDLWTYNPVSQLWTWVGGSNGIDALGVYGTRGVATTGNGPGARYGASAWHDADGNGWIFGGKGFDSVGGADYLNDLWEYSANTGQWTWMAGADALASSGTYGSIGVAAGGNVPGGRGSSASWVDLSGNFWLLGGVGYDSAGTGGYLNDLWEYQPLNGLWTWVGGSSTANAAGRYGTKGTAGQSNVPGARAFPMGWFDTTGRLWLFGGVGVDANSATNYLNDFWVTTP